MLTALQIGPVQGVVLLVLVIAVLLMAGHWLFRTFFDGSK